MQLSFNIIKSPQIEVSGEEVIKTEYDTPKPKKEVIKQQDLKENFNNLSRYIIEDAKKKAQTILDEAEEKIAIARDEAVSIQKEAYDFGYKEGHDKGYNDGYDKAIKEAEEKANNIILNAEKILYSAKEQYENYFKEKKEEILNTICDISYAYLKKEVENESIIISMIEEELEKIKNSDTILIKYNSHYDNEMKKNLDIWKTSMRFCKNIFLVPNEDLELGEVIIEKDNGKCTLNLEYAVDKIKKEIFK